MNMHINPVDVAVLQERLIAIVREMRVNLMRTAFSSVIYESQDYSCALLDASGQLVAQAEDNPSHIFPMPYSTRKILEIYAGTIRPGDVFIVNDPYIGGTHLNDVAIVAPYFFDGKMQIIPAVRAHWGDVGGMVPGSLSGKAENIYQEGIRIPPLRIIEEGQPNDELMQLMLANMRAPGERKGDLNAMLSTCHVAQRRLDELFIDGGSAAIGARVARMLDDSERQMRSGIGRIKRGDYWYENYLDSSGLDNQPLPIRLKLSIREDSIEADFEGTAGQVLGPTNGGVAVAPTGVFVILKSFLTPGTAVNEGAFRPIKLNAPKGTILNAKHPAACGGFSEIRRAVEAAVLGCLSQAIPDLISGDTKGAANHCTISSFDPTTDRAYLFYEYPAGGTGGWKGADGNNATRIFSEGDFSSIQPVEAVEAEHPLLVERCELREDSCGAGEKRGGLGLRREIRVLKDARLSVLSDRNVVPPFGVCGGSSGGPNRFIVRRQNDLIEPSNTPGKCSGFELYAGDVVVMESAGGGGYGDPLTRNVAAVARDVVEGYISKEYARSHHGVVWGHEHVDEAGTGALRDERGRMPQLVHIEATAEDIFSNGLRLLQLPIAQIQKLGLEQGDLVELLTRKGASLRAWVAPVQGEQTRVPLGPIGRAILGCSNSSAVEFRKLRHGPPAPRI